MPANSDDKMPDGVHFPSGGDGKRSTSATGRAIFADCARGVAPELADRIEHTKDWRAGYLRPIRDIVAAATATPDAALQISRDGLASAHRRFRFGRDGQELSVDAAMGAFTAPGFGSVQIQGNAQLDSDLSVPYRGKRLFGRHLRDQVDKWVDDGIAEPSFGAAIHLVLDNPDWLDLRGVDIALLGAGAEMGPTRSLLRWGATVHAIDLRRPAIWQRLIDITRSTAGSVRIPIEFDADGHPPLVLDGLVHPEDDVVIANVAGANLLTRTPEVRTWLAEIEQPFVLGTYAYADGATHALLSMAADAVVADLLGSRNDITLAYLATPTDTFMVPLAAVLESRRRWDSRGLSGLLQAPCAPLSNLSPIIRTPWWPPMAPKSALTTRSSPSRVRTTRWPNGCSGGAHWWRGQRGRRFQLILRLPHAPNRWSRIERWPRLTPVRINLVSRCSSRQRRPHSWLHSWFMICAILQPRLIRAPR